jgi:wyosine [tRNA(Phe)-imidazoG37] synthetase (radical SAM superfamily)
MPVLDIHDHRRDAAGFTYVYPVISRRAGGVSIGVNLNPNNACNWACIYCQVPDLTRGNAPRIDLALLETELRSFLLQVVNGDWLARNVPEEARRLQDIAFSGNGEPTSTREFPQTVELVGQLLAEFGLMGKIKVRLITNGSLMLRKPVQDALEALSRMNGEIWFKVDRATSEGMLQVNQIDASMAGVRRRLRACAARCPTWIQTCWFNLDGKPPSGAEFGAYLDFVREMRANIAGVHLYGLARQPMQPGAEHLSAMPAQALEAYGAQIRQLGIPVNISV